MDKKVNKIDELIKERNRLYISKENPKRLKEIIDLIDKYNYGFK